MLIFWNNFKCDVYCIFLDQKAHKNGITRPKRQRSESTRGVSIRLSWFSVSKLFLIVCLWLFQMDAKFLRNLRFSKKHNVSREEAQKRFEERKSKNLPKPVKL